MSLDDNICPLCGKPGAIDFAKWTVGGFYWPGETSFENEHIHADCEAAEARRAMQAIPEAERAPLAFKLRKQA